MSDTKTQDASGSFNFVQRQEDADIIWHIGWQGLRSDFAV